jgi:superoxide dismutase, Fe-Mn family
MNIMTKPKLFELSPLPYDENALEPVISARTIGYHHGKHHKAYVDKLNELVKDTEYAQMRLEDVVKATFGDSSKHEIFNNAAQVWNHTFFWACLTPGGGKPQGELMRAIDREFGGFDKFKEKFAHEGVAQFGSGWVWLVAYDNDRIGIEKTPDAATPMAEGKKCLLAIDVWEHAYYLDYQNRRPDFLEAVTGKLLNWDFAMQNFRRSG